MIVTSVVFLRGDIVHMSRHVAVILGDLLVLWLCVVGDDLSNIGALLSLYRHLKWLQRLDCGLTIALYVDTSLVYGLADEGWSIGCMIRTPPREISQLQEENSRQKLPVDQYCVSGFEILVRPDEYMNEAWD